ncbi:MAG: periplasmic protein TonB [Holophagaceae bacterium]|nr:periplasmic protein TonB [Holophagaceae bacterium]
MAVPIIDENLLDSIYRDHLSGDFRGPSRTLVLGFFIAVTGLLMGLGFLCFHHGACQPVRQVVSIALDDGIYDAGSPPPPPPPPPGGGAAQSFPQTKDAEEKQPEKSPEPADTPQPLTLPQASAAPSGAGVPGGVQGGEVGGVPGGVVGGSKGGLVGGVLGGTGDANAVIPPRADAAYLRNPAPVYPVYCRRARETGTVVLKVLVKPDGHVEQVEIKASSGFPRLDAAALEAVRRWVFVAAHRGSEAVAAWVHVPITFNLE